MVIIMDGVTVDITLMAKQNALHMLKGIFIIFKVSIAICQTK